MGGQTSKREMACSNLITCVQNRSPHNTIHIFSSIRTDSCQDKIANCNSYKQQGYCESMPDTMKNYCPKTCFACGELAINFFFFLFWRVHFCNIHAWSWNEIIQTALYIWSKQLQVSIRTMWPESPCSANQYPSKSPQTFAHLVNFSKTMCLSCLIIVQSCFF